MSGSISYFLMFRVRKAEIRTKIIATTPKSDENNCDYFGKTDSQGNFFFVLIAVPLEKRICKRMSGLLEPLRSTTLKPFNKRSSCTEDCFFMHGLALRYNPEEKNATNCCSNLASVTLISMKINGFVK